MFVLAETCPFQLQSSNAPLEETVMVDFEAVITHFGPQAVELQLSEAEADKPALAAIRKNAEPASGRVEQVRSWLLSYKVFQGIDSLKRTAITEAVLRWADCQDDQRNLRAHDALVQAHQELAGRCSIAYGSRREFTSLASKALWLRYPDTVPLFDSFARRALWVIGKIERDIAPPAHQKSEYGKFTYAWKILYERYASSMAGLDTKGYPS